MFELLLVVHLIVCVLLIAAILMQKSEGGGALGIGGGPSGLMSGRSAANLMTRTTSILGGLFFIISLTLTLLASSNQKPAGSIMQDPNSKNGIPTNKIDLSVPKTTAPEQTAPKIGIPESDAAPQTGGLLGTNSVIGGDATAKTEPNTANDNK
jgi:preprotein translocase subunit SecG